MKKRLWNWTFSFTVFFFTSSSTTTHHHYRGQCLSIMVVTLVNWFVHSQQDHVYYTAPSPPPCRRTWHNLTEMHRHYPFTAQRPAQKLQEAKCKRKELCILFLPPSPSPPPPFSSSSSSLWFVKYLCFSATTSRLVSYNHQTFTWESWQRLKQRRRPHNKEAHL